MDRNVRMAKELVRLAKALVADDGSMADARNLKKDIDRAKKRIENQVKKNGICENLGADEVRALKDKYDVYNREAGDLIADFEEWCMTYSAGV